VRRARISSQCLKRHARLWFEAESQMPIGIRTKKLKGELAKRLEGRDPAALDRALNAFIATYYSGMDKDQTTVLQYVSPAELDIAVACITEQWETLAAEPTKGAKSDKGKEDREAMKKIKEALEAAQRSPDMALFGRMLAEHAERNIEAATQVAHAISTHRVEMELDFYTAVDDLNPEGTTGAGMMGYTGFNSACFYRYALVDRQQLLDNLVGDARLTDQVIEAFLRASIFAIPEARQHGMAAQNLPAFGLLVVRQGGAPCNLANAFAKPVVPTQDTDLISASVAALAHYWEKLNAVYGLQGAVATAVFQVDQEAHVGALAASDCGAVDAAIARVMSAATPEGAVV
ncbi:MAG TPA: type I-E CRISPR-associated protein Cas7/Cse4/CasC, partial [Anaerolineae bacterium]